MVGTVNLSQEASHDQDMKNEKKAADVVVNTKMKLVFWFAGKVEWQPLCESPLNSPFLSRVFYRTKGCWLYPGSGVSIMNCT